MIARSPIRKRRRKPRPGRLAGKELEALRDACLARDKGRCVVCACVVSKDADHMLPWSFHMAHIRNKRMWGDTLENVRTLCGFHHRQEHQQGPTRQKPCPPKPTAE